MIAACSDCALVDAVCDEPVDLGAHPSLASGDLRFQYNAPVVMAGAAGSNRELLRARRTTKRAGAKRGSRLRSSPT